MISFEEFNDNINDVLNPFLTNIYFNGFLKIFLVLYGSLAAPALPSSVAPFFSNTLFRIAVMTLIVWSYQHDPALSILVAVVYFLSMRYLSKKLTEDSYSTGIVTAEAATVLSGGSGPSIKSSDDMKIEAQKFQSVVDAAKIPVPVVPTPTPTPVVVPASVTAPTMKSTEDHVPQVPQAFIPDDVHNLAHAPVSK
jgi:hypothetical protein